MRTICALMVLSLGPVWLTGCAGPEEDATLDTRVTGHMIAEATLAAHYVAAALEAGATAEEINATLAEIAEATVISEFWVSDENGRVEFTSVPGLEFAFPTDPDAGTQAAPFANLLLGREKVVAQGMMPREADGALYQYVGVAGVDKPRIVQVGFAGSQQ